MNYLLLYENNIASELQFDENYNVVQFIIHNKYYLPPYIAIEENIDNTSFDNWIKHRKISSARENIQEVLEEYNVENTKELFIKNYGLSLTDHYWIKPLNDSKKWKDINFFENDFSTKMGDILIGNGFSSEETEISPESTSGGMLPKKWDKKEDGIYLIRKSNKAFAQESFNEIIANEIMSRLNINNVKYKIEWQNNKPFSVCKNFLNKDQELIHANDFVHVINYDDKYNNLIKICKNKNMHNIKRNLDEMLIVDYIIGNTDRHSSNYGFIRNTKTLQYEGFAPIYDNGSSLWHNKHEIDINILHNITSKPFKPYHNEQIKLVDLNIFDSNKLDNLSDFINDTFKANDRITEKRRNLIIYGVMYKIDQLKKLQEINNFIKE